MPPPPVTIQCRHADHVSENPAARMSSIRRRQGTPLVNRRKGVRIYAINARAKEVWVRINCSTWNHTQTNAMWMTMVNSAPTSWFRQVRALLLSCAHTQQPCVRTPSSAAKSNRDMATPQLTEPRWQCQSCDANPPIRAAEILPPYGLHSGHTTGFLASSASVIPHSSIRS